MNIKEFEAVIKLPAPKRYEYFIKKVADADEVWGLYNEGWAMAADNDEVTVIPFWPKKEFAEANARGLWADYIPEVINLDDFLNEWLPGLEKDHIKPAIFYTTNDKGIVIESKRLLDDLNRELENY